MRREEKKKFWSKQNIVSLFIVLILISSVIGFIWGRGGIQREKYGGYSFIRKGNEWVLKTDIAEIAFDYFPTEVEYINLSSEIASRMLNTFEIDSTYDVEDPYVEGIALAQHGLSQVLGYMNIYLRKGLTAENEYGLPVIICEDATITVPVIYFKKSNQTRIYLEDDCIIAEASEEIDFIRIKDRLLYGVLGIIK